LLGQEKALSLLEKALNFSNSLQTEALYIGKQESLTRYTNSVVHQNVIEENTILSIRAVNEGRVGCDMTNSLDERSIKESVEKANIVSKVQPQEVEFYSLPPPAPYKPLEIFVEATAEYSPEDKARDIGIIIRIAERAGVKAAGAFSTINQEIAIASTLGVRAYCKFTTAFLSNIMFDEESSGYADRISRDVRELNPQAVAWEALQRCLENREAKELSPGEYEVVLEEYAVADLIEYLAFMGFSALSFQEGYSFMSGNIGKELVDKKITIWDDGLDIRGLAQPFDYEGVPKRKVELITEGVAKGVVYNSQTAFKEWKLSTGHALPAPNVYGPLPLNLFVKGGDTTEEEMISQVERGLLITRFHYIREMHTLKTLITGMTRDGVIYIENGKKKYPVKNMRFTQSILEALKDVRGISRDTKLQSSPEGFGCAVVPKMHLGRFNFTGISKL